MPEIIFRIFRIWSNRHFNCRYISRLNWDFRATKIGRRRHFHTFESTSYSVEFNNPNLPHFIEPAEAYFFLFFCFHFCDFSNRAKHDAGGLHVKPIEYVYPIRHSPVLENQWLGVSDQTCPVDRAVRSRCAHVLSAASSGTAFARDATDVHRRERNFRRF